MSESLQEIYRRLRTERKMSEDVFSDISPPHQSISKLDVEEVFMNTILAENLFRGIVVENEEEHGVDYTFEISEPDSPNEELVDYFSSTLKIAVRGFTLTPYTKEELSKFRLFILNRNGVRDQSGFAIKKRGGVYNELVAVHKTKSTKTKKLGDIYMKRCLREGVRHLDHFDGFLTSIYAPYKFVVTDVYVWDDRYKPDGWNKTEEGFDINGMEVKQSSVYRGLDDIDGEDVRIDNYVYKNFSYEEKRKQYLSGEVDVIQRMR